MGEGITEATLVKWLKKKGEEVRKDEPLLEVSTDKVDTEIPSPASGFLLETAAAEGETVSVNSVIALIGENGATPVRDAKTPLAAKKAGPSDKSPDGMQAAQPPRHSEQGGQRGEEVRRPAAAPAPQAPAFKATGPVKSSPLVRKIARAKNIDLTRVPGTGMHGRITKGDIEAFMAGGSVTAAAPTTSAPAETGPAHLQYGRLQTRKENGTEMLEGVPVRREKMSKMRALIAEHMVRSVRTSPHVTTIFEMDLHKIVGTREKHREAFAAKEGFNLTYTPFFVWAAVQAIKENPVVNVSVDGEDILWKDDINVGVAVALENGLIVPVIRKAGELNFLGVARRMNDMVVRARSKKLTPEDVQGGTFSITNPGMFGSIVSSPIINQPQVAIMSIGAIIKRPVVINDMIAFRPLCQIGLTFDHRVVDGEGGAKYLASLKKHLEHFNEPVI